MSIWICGEVLIDVLPTGAVVGGGPANTARALARLGHDVEFIGGISSDFYGQKAREIFLEDDVGLRHVLNSDLATCTATVTLDEHGSASYVFDIDGTATFDFRKEWLPDPSRYKPSMLHVGTLATIIEPGAGELYEWAIDVSEFAPIIYDPNVRWAVLGDRKKYVENVDKWVDLASIVKVSDEDLLWLYPEENPVAIALDWIAAGVVLVVITKGDAGITGITSDDIFDVPSAKVKVIDTVGAGDTVGAIFSEAVIEYGITNLRGEVLREVLHRAAVAAGITCSREGAQPPARFELNHALQQIRNER